MAATEMQLTGSRGEILVVLPYYGHRPATSIAMMTTLCKYVYLTPPPPEICVYLISLSIYAVVSPFSLTPSPSLFSPIYTVRQILRRNLRRRQHPRHRPRTLVLRRRQRHQKRDSRRNQRTTHRPLPTPRRRQRRRHRGIPQRQNRIFLRFAHDGRRTNRHDGNYRHTW